MMPAALAAIINMAIVIDLSPALRALSAIHDPFSGCQIWENMYAVKSRPRRVWVFGL
jgi:hypothetical protein